MRRARSEQLPAPPQDLLNGGGHGGGGGGVGRPPATSNPVERPARRQKSTVPAETTSTDAPNAAPRKEVRIPRFAELDAEIATKEAARAKPQKSPGSKKPGRKRQSPPLPREYQQEVIRIAKEHRKKFKGVFAADRTTRDRGARLYRSLLLPLRRGKKPTSRVLKAVAFIKNLGRKPKSSDWNRIDVKCLPSLGALPDLERRDRRRKFHHTVQTYLRRHNIQLA